MHMPISVGSALRFAGRRALMPAAIVLVAVPASAQPSGEAVYRERCAGCHDQVTPRVPPRDALQKLPATRILRTLDFGVMMNIAYPLKRDEREAVAKYLGTTAADAEPPPSAYCSDRTVKIVARPARQWNGWSPTNANTRFQPASAAGLTLEQVRRLELKWAFAFDGDVSAFSQPTVLDDTLFVGSAAGRVHALSAGSGCIRWVFQANGPVRSSILAVPVGQRHALMFSDLVGWVYSLDAETGRVLWKKRIEEHEATRLTGAPVVHNGIVFVPAASWEESRSVGAGYPCCTFRGSVVALRVGDGSQVWKRYTITEEAKPTGTSRAGTPQWGPSGAGVWGSPTVDARRNRLYITTGDNYSTPATTTSDAVMALDLLTGRTVWSKQMTANDAYNSACGDTAGANCPPERGPDYDFGSSALLLRTATGRELVVAGQKSGMVYAFDPDKQGELVWQARVGKGGVNGGVQWGMASDGRNVYAAVSDVVRIAKANPNPADPARFDLNPREGGGLTALRLEDGQKVWYAQPPPCSERPGCSPAQSAALTAIPDVVFSGSLDGHLRAFAARDGQVVWDFDTVREYDTANGIRARGGSLDGPGAVVVGGMVYVNSGYSRFGGMAGNVLLAFAPKP
jgi:polyvinyl alcohol dehydrogenase (cytochrome)